ncbi:hypothetical protein O181_011593 [Austropuccinia psidii MF-1]|uniref:Uncharacterized protein n=1 Tax=Austropuccinia psidii MF-1 TaxID=1389203 RepID=A0A9Q3GLF0_9BASI|nr:hypothetical protein [Austropuccinia psidii MF-1]
MIQTMKDIIRRCCAYGMEYKDHEGHTHGWITHLPAIELDYNTIQRSTTAKDFHDIWKRECDKVARCIAEEKDYNKKRHEKTHKEPEFRKFYQVLVSTLNFDNPKGPKKMRDSFLVSFNIIKLIGTNAVEVKLSEAFSRKYLVFPVSLVKP